MHVSLCANIDRTSAPKSHDGPLPLVHGTLHPLPARDGGAEMNACRRRAPTALRLCPRRSQDSFTYDESRGGWADPRQRGVYWPVNSSIRPPDTPGRCRRRRDHPADARRFELRRRDQWTGTGPRTLSEDATGRWGLPRTMGWATGVDEAQIVDDVDDGGRFRPRALSLWPSGGYRKIPSGKTSPEVFVMFCPKGFGGDRQ